MAIFDEHPGVFVIAEAGVNHNGDLALARALIDGAAEAGADAVKFQLFRPEKLTSKSAPLAAYQEQASPATESQRELLRKLALSFESFRNLQEYARHRRILFLCTPFDEDSARFLHHELRLPALKISSGELTNLPFLEMLGALETPLMLSTGMGTLEEAQAAVAAVQRGGHAPIALLHCVSAYPAPIEAVNLHAIHTLKAAFPGCAIGYSDHTQGAHVPVAAVAMGARIIEKHFTLDRALPGPDHAASLTVPELREMIRLIRETEAALGDGVKQPQPCETDCLRVARKSLVAASDLPGGHVLTVEDIAIKRPGTGISPARLGDIIGCRLPAPLAADDLIPASLLTAFQKA